MRRSECLKRVPEFLADDEPHLVVRHQVGQTRGDDDEGLVDPDRVAVCHRRLDDKQLRLGFGVQYGDALIEICELTRAHPTAELARYISRCWRSRNMPESSLSTWSKPLSRRSAVSAVRSAGCSQAWELTPGKVVGAVAGSGVI